MSQRIVKRAEPGTTHDAYQFGKQLHWALSNLVKFPLQFYPKNTSPVYEEFKRYFVLHPTPFTQFKLILFICPRRKQIPRSRENGKVKQPMKNNHHWILINDFYAGFFEQFLPEWGYRRNSDIFATDFLPLANPNLNKWLEFFHIHFRKAKDVGSTEKSWKDFILSQHHSDLSDLLRYRCEIWEFNATPTDDRDKYSEVGYDTVNTKMLYSECLTMI